jgi:hypothetical protein
MYVFRYSSSPATPLFFFSANARSSGYSLRRGKSDPVYREIRSKTVQHQKPTSGQHPKPKTVTQPEETQKHPPAYHIFDDSTPPLSFVVHKCIRNMSCCPSTDNQYSRNSKKNDKSYQLEERTPFVLLWIVHGCHLTIYLKSDFSCPLINIGDRG